MPLISQTIPHFAKWVRSAELSDSFATRVTVRPHSGAKSPLFCQLHELPRVLLFVRILNR
jgi:hypothetical protein